jgi:hypothetical protein
MSESPRRAPRSPPCVVMSYDYTVLVGRHAGDAQAHKECALVARNGTWSSSDGGTSRSIVEAPAFGRRENSRLAAFVEHGKAQSNGL